MNKGARMEEIEPDKEAMSVFSSRSRLLKWLPSIQGLKKTTSGSSGAQSQESQMERRMNIGGKISYKGEEET